MGGSVSLLLLDREPFKYRDCVPLSFDSLMSEMQIIKSSLNEETEIQTSSKASHKPSRMRVWLEF